jgi:spore maturation protein CgeB
MVARPTDNMDVSTSAFEGMIRGVRELGHFVETIYLDGRTLREVYEQILGFSPHLFLFWGRWGLAPQMGTLLSQLGIPHACWYTGRVPYTELNKEKAHNFFSPYFFLFLVDRCDLDHLNRKGFENVSYLPLATDPQIFRRIELTDDQREQYGCQISFAGGSGYPFYQVYLMIKEKIKDHDFLSFMEETVRVKIQSPDFNVLDYLREPGNRPPFPISLKEHLPYIGISEEEAFDILISFAAFPLYRKEILERVISSFRLHLYGDEKWRCWDSIVLNRKVRFKGWINNRIGLPILYNASQINLNITSNTLTALPMRVFDIMACGGFLLTDYRADLEELFEVGREVVYYQDGRDLCKKIEYYLAHPKERETIARCGQEKVLREHIYKRRIEKLISVIRDKILATQTFTPMRNNFQKRNF